MRSIFDSIARALKASAIGGPPDAGAAFPLRGAIVAQPLRMGCATLELRARRMSCEQRWAGQPSCMYVADDVRAELDAFLGLGRFTAAQQATPRRSQPMGGLAAP